MNSVNIVAMSRRYGLPALIASAALNAVALIILAKNHWKVDLGPSLSIVASLALVAITWIYTQQTRNLVEAQERQLVYQRGQGQFAAVSELWSVSFSLQDTIHYHRIRMSDPFKKGLTLDERFEEAQSIEEGSKRLREYATNLLRLAVALESPLDTSTWVMANEISEVALDMARFANCTMEECVRAKDDGNDFIVANVASVWEKPDDIKHLSNVRWAEMQSGVSLKNLVDKVLKYRDECQNAVKRRA